MILPIFLYGHSVLKERCKEIDEKQPDLEELISNMWETMYAAQGVGLAAPQIGKSIRLFLVDTIQMKEEGDEKEGIKQAFLNPEILEEKGEEWSYEEGCLSIPNVRGDVDRKEIVRIKYQDTSFKWHEAEFDGLEGRVIQHEYDHIDGKLFIDYLKPIRKRRVQKKLNNIKKGIVDADYKIKRS